MRACASLLIPLLLAANAALGGEDPSPAAQWQRLELGAPSSAYQFAAYSNRPLAGSQEHVVQAVVIQHGLQRDGDRYYRAAAKVMSELRLDDTRTLLVAPQFLAAPDAKKGDVSGMPLWTRGGWMGGENAGSGKLSLSSLEVLDDLLLWFADRQRFPALTRIVLAGHSGGAQLLQRYAVLNRVDERLKRAGITLRYVIANPSSYLYFTDERPQGDSFERYGAAATCPGFNDFKYGFAKAIAYATGIEPHTAFERYATRDVVYLLGEKDINPNGRVLDKTCAAEAQGAHRLERGLAYLRYERHLGGERVKLAHDAYLVLGVAHDYQGMLGSACGVEAIFGARAPLRSGHAQCNPIIERQAARVSAATWNMRSEQ